MSQKSAARKRSEVNCIPQQMVQMCNNKKSVRNFSKANHHSIFQVPLDDTQIQHIWPDSLSSKEASDIPLHQVNGEIRRLKGPEVYGAHPGKLTLELKKNWRCIAMFLLFQDSFGVFSEFHVSFGGATHLWEKFDVKSHQPIHDYMSC